MTLNCMNSRMAGSAKRLEVFQRVVPLFTRRRNAQSVEVVDMQIILGAATLAGMIITLQGFDTVAAKAVIILGFLAILPNLLRVIGGPSPNAGNMRIIAARFALALRTSRIFKWGSAVFAREPVAFPWRASGVSFCSAILRAFALAVHLSTSFTRILRTACRFVFVLAYHALTVGKATFGLSMSRKRTRLASLCVWGSPRCSSAAVRAVDLTVGSHKRHSMFDLNIYSGGAA